MLQDIGTLSRIAFSKVEKKVKWISILVAHTDTDRFYFSFSAYLINGKVEDVVFRSGYRMWCTHLAATETIAVASSVSKTAVDLAGEGAYRMSRGDCR